MTHSILHSCILVGHFYSEPTGQQGLNSKELSRNEPYVSLFHQCLTTSAVLDAALYSWYKCAHCLRYWTLIEYIHVVAIFFLCS